MNIINNPQKDTWRELTRRPQLELEFLESSVGNILNRVKLSGDDALREFAWQFDHAKIESIRVLDHEIAIAANQLDGSIKTAIGLAASNIRAFHEIQKREAICLETMPGVVCWRKSIAIQKVGIYIPGGTAPLFSTVLMLAIPAVLAGCNEIILCSPPGNDGAIPPAILYAASLSGIKNIFKAGGAQAIAAMAYGTGSIPAVYKIFGPGNQYVTQAKQMVSRDGVAIDMPAGPSELMVIADDSAIASYVAADLLSQAEHGPDSQVVLLALNESKIHEVKDEIERQLPQLPRKEIALQALQNSLAIYFNKEENAIQFANEYAPEHLIINTGNCDAMADKIVNAGSVFLGNFSPEAVGDYASWTNHTLPTNGFAKAYSGVSLESFTKTITYQKLTETGLKNLGPSVEILAGAEQLEGHKRAVALRLQNQK